MTLLLVQFFTLVILGCVTVEVSALISVFPERKLSAENAELTVRQLLTQHGYRGESHTIYTKDGYILGLHRITGRKSDARTDGKQPVLIVHGLLSSSIDFLITGPGRALGFVLADEGYDVWLGNVRGNVFSRRHQNYTSLDKDYWQFSWHESGVEDLPAMMDYILEYTNRHQLLYVGHSQGTTVFWVMASERPDYQDKVKAMIALAPVAYMTYMRSPLLRVIAMHTNNIGLLFRIFGRYEFEPSGQLIKQITTTLCNDKSWTLSICTNTMFLTVGPVSDQLNTTMLPMLLLNVAGASVRQVIHFGQVMQSQRFQQYDHGLMGNLLKYKQRRPPTYDLSKNKVPVYLHYSLNDWLTVPMDVYHLYKELGNPIGMFQVPYEEFTHLDFIWANDSKELLYNKVLQQMRKYKD